MICDGFKVKQDDRIIFHVSNEWLAVALSQFYLLRSYSCLLEVLESESLSVSLCFYFLLAVPSSPRLQVAAWFTDGEQRTGMAVCRLKNNFSVSLCFYFLLAVPSSPRLQVAAWFTDGEQRTGMAVCRLKNNFSRFLPSRA